MYHYNSAQWQEQFLQIGRLDRVSILFALAFYFTSAFAFLLFIVFHIFKYFCLSNAMHGQNINLPVCVCVCLRPLNGFLQSILWQLKRRGFTQGCAFWGSRWSHLGVQSPPKTPIFGGLNMHFKPYMRKIQTAISSDLCIRLTWNLTGTSWVVSYGGKTIPRWRTAAILKIDISPYLNVKSSDFHDVIKKWKKLHWTDSEFDRTYFLF